MVWRKSASAGSILAGKTVEEAYLFDRNQAGIEDFGGLDLVDGIVILHYTEELAQKYAEISDELAERALAEI